MELLQSQTFQNLKTAFMRESSAFMEYEFYSIQAKNDGLINISNKFKQTAKNEWAHAEIWFKLYHTIMDTQQNLLNSSKLEKFEWQKMYSDFSSVALKEGFKDIAKLFQNVGNIEKQHQNTFSTLEKSVKTKKVFSANDNSVWICLNCGHIVKGKTPPSTCPVCSHPQAYFTLKK